MQKAILTKARIVELLKEHGGRPGLVAESLGTYRTKVWRAMKKYEIRKEPFRPQPHRRSPFFSSKPPLGTPLEREVERLRLGGLAHNIFLFIENASIPPSTREILGHFALSMRPKNISRVDNRINAILYKLRRRGPIVLIPANGVEKIDILNFDDRWTLPIGFWTRL